MIMRQLTNAWRMFLVGCACVLGFASCGDDVYYTIENTDEALCGRLWVDDDYVTDEGYEGTYQLRFHQGGKGQEVRSWQMDGGTNTFDREMTWRWTDSSKECLQLTFPDGASKYFENVWVRQHYLSGKLDGREVTMVSASSQH